MQAASTDLGVNAVREGRFKEARVALENELRNHPQDETAKSFLAIARAALGECGEADAEFQRTPSESFRRLLGLAAVQCDAASGSTQRSVEIISKLQKLYPADPDVLYETAKLHRQAWDAAVRRLYERAPNSYRVNQISAEVFEAEGKYAEAAAQYRTAIGKAPDALNLHYRLGRCFLLASSRGEDLNKAKAEFEAEIQLNPKDAVAFYQVGQILAVQQRSSEAITQFERAVQIREDFPEALIAIGKARVKEKQFNDAAELFQRVLANHPDNEAARYNLMLAYRDLGRPEDAAKQKQELDRIQKPPEGEFSHFLEKIGEKAPPK